MAHALSDIEVLLTGALPEENLKDYNIEIVGTSGKGDGFIGDIYFVNLTSKKKNYNFVLKCGKPSAVFRETFPVKAACDREIFIYNSVWPAYKKFEIAHSIDDVFDSVPKCYGTFTGQGKEVIVLENLKTLGYGLWDKKLPLPRNYLETVLKQYGKLHAISAAMQDQEPETFGKLVNNILLSDVWSEFCKSTNFCTAYAAGVEGIAKILEGDIEQNALNEWKQIINHMEYYVFNLRKKSATFNVITHGDCWNNNFMFKTTGDDENSKEVKVAILDWQLSGFSSPVNDVSYFLYACVSEEDLKDFDGLLKIYYRSFAKHLTKLGSDPEKIYTYSNLLDDWKVYARLGIAITALVFHVVCADQDDTPDLVEITEKGGSFCPNVKYVDVFKQRSKCLLQHAVERKFLKPLGNY